MKKQENINESLKRNIESNLNDNEAQNLKYNKEENSYELDVVSNLKEYQHLDPYDTAADNGDDMNSDYD